MPMPVQMEPVDAIPGLLIVHTGVAADDRGFFAESYSRSMWSEAGFTEAFVQDNLSCSKRGALRGMHYQLAARGMGKLVRAVKGGVYDVAVDLRRGSPSFGQWHGIELTAANRLSFWVPPGFAHGFLALDDDTLVLYKCTAHHAPEAERALSYRCPEVAIDWPLEPTIVSPKDAQAPMLSDAEYDFVYEP